MDDAARRRDGLDIEPTIEVLEPVPQAFSTSEDDRYDGDVHLVDQVGGKELADRRHASADAHVEITRQLAGPVKGFGSALVDEVERRPALHLEDRPDVM